MALTINLTAEGIAALPGLPDANINDSVGFCHGHFEGDIDGLSVCAFDVDELRCIIGVDSRRSLAPFSSRLFSKRLK